MVVPINFSMISDKRIYQAIAGLVGILGIVLFIAILGASGGAAYSGENRNCVTTETVATTELGTQVVVPVEICEDLGNVRVLP